MIQRSVPAALLLALAALPAAAQDPSQGLVGWWKGNDAAATTAKDSSGFGHDGSYQAGATLSADAPVLSGANPTSMDFDGISGIVNVPDFTVKAGSAITIAFWNRVEVDDVKMSVAFIVGAGPLRCQAHVPWVGNTLYWDFGDIDFSGRLTTDYSAKLGKWTHVALVSSGAANNFRGIYLDGVLAASAGSSSSLNADYTGLNIGGQPGYLEKGKIDDFRIYNRVLSAAEIQMLASGWTPAAAPPGAPTALMQQDAATSAAIPAGAAITATSFVASAVSIDPDGGSVHLEAECRLVGTAFTGVATAPPGPAVPGGNVASVTIAGLAPFQSLHWQVRALNAAGRASAWVPFGTTPDAPSEIDLKTKANLPPTLAAPAQSDAAGGAPLHAGALLLGSAVCLAADIADPDGDSVELQVEVIAAGAAFSGVPTASGDPVIGGGHVSILIPVGPGFFRWQARSVDARGAASAWSAYGAGGADFSVQSGGSEGATGCAGSASGAAPLPTLLLLAALAAARPRA